MSDVSELAQVQLVVVDDDPAFLQLVEGACVDLGLVCRTHKRIADFERDLAGRHADIVIIDGLLPDGSGIDVAKAVAAQPAPRPRVIFASAIFKKFQVFKELRAAGVEQVLTKPVEPAALAALLGAIRDDILPTLSPPVVSIEAARPMPTEAAPPPRPAPVERRDTTRLDAQRAMAALRETYAESFPALAAELRHRLDSWASGDEDARGLLRQKVHRLAGTAGSFGFLGLSGLAAEIDGDLADGATVVAVSARIGKLADLLVAGGGDDRPPRADSPRKPAARLLVVAPVGWSIAAPADDIDVRIEPPALAVAAGAMFDPSHLAIAGSHADMQAAAAAVSLIRDRIGRRLPWACIAARDELAERAFAAEIGAPVFLAGDLSAAEVVSALDASHRSGLGAASVLVVDDDPAVCEEIRGLLEPHGIVVETVDTPDAAWEVLQQQSPTLLLVDVSLPFYDGHQFCRMLKGDPDLRNVTVVMLSERLGVDDRLAAFRAGAVDILVKPLVPEEFLLRVQRNLEQVQRYERDVSRDFLTRLPNRSAFEKEVRHRLGRMRRERGRDIASAVVMFDIDHFKRINDTAGHLTGDRALQEFAGALEQTLRAGDFCARWGGEEFVVLTAGASPEELRRLFLRIGNALKGRPVFGPGGYETILSVSAGATQLTSEDDAEAALGRADRALYRAKSEGRGCLRLG
jgi:diguanylate cyclase (GGDEF)-like protein